MRLPDSAIMATVNHRAHISVDRAHAANQPHEGRGPYTVRTIRMLPSNSLLQGSSRSAFGPPGTARLAATVRPVRPGPLGAWQALTNSEHLVNHVARRGTESRGACILPRTVTSQAGAYQTIRKTIAVRLPWLRSGKVHLWPITAVLSGMLSAMWNSAHLLK